MKNGTKSVHGDLEPQAINGIERKSVQMAPVQTERLTHGFKRHGTTVCTLRSTRNLTQEHLAKEFLRFMRLITRQS